MRGWFLVLVAGCGRIGFDAGAATDAPNEIDATPREACPALPGLLFCESFEGAPLLPSITGNVVVDDSRAFAGTRSQHAMTTGVSESAWQIGLVLPFVMSGDLYARWYVYIPSSITNLQLASVHLVENDLPYHGVIFGFDNGYATIACTEANRTAVASVPVPRERWVCAEMHVRISDTDGFIEGSIDGARTTSVLGIDTLPVGGYHNVHAGLFASDIATEPMEMWTDEIAIGTEPIACDD